MQPPCAQTEAASMSQKSGGEAGPLPSVALACGDPSTSSSLAVGAPCSAPTSKLLTAPQHMHSEDGAMEATAPASSRPSSSATTAAADMGSGVQQAQNTPSKRRPALSISPPPEDLFDESQMSCQEEPSVPGPPTAESEHSSSMWADDSLSNFSLISTVSYNDNNEVPRKSRKRTPRQRPGPKAAPPEDSMDVFDADSAKAPHFVLSQLGSDKNSGPESGSTVKSGQLCGQFPQRSDGKELKILVQPETQHRARYLTEGSRGSVKDRTQQGFPTVKLEGVNEAVTLQVFVANDAGRVKPHGFYQACKVTGRNTTACTEVDIEGTTVIEIPLEPSNDMTLAVDCVGILKLRNADVEARIGVAGSKKKSTRARLAFRVNIPQPDGSVLTLQVPSSAILCTQPAGVPEILKKSLHTCSVKGGEEVFIIGKNFLKGTKVIFQENITDENSWQAEGKIDMDLFHQNHLIVTVPPFHDLSITCPVSVGIFVMTNAGKSHDPQTFTYTPDSVDNSAQAVKAEGASLVKTCIFDEQIMSSEQTDGSGPMSKQEVTPMEVSSHPPTDMFKVRPPQQRFVVLGTGSYSLPPAPSVFPSLDSPSTIQKQDIGSSTGAFPVSDTSIPPVTPEVPQQFLREPQESTAPDTSNSSGGVVVVALPSQPQPQVSMFVQDGVAQLEQAVRELQAGNSTTLQQVLEAAVAQQQQQQQLNSVLYSPTPSAESLQQHVQENMNSLCLGTNDSPLSTRQHLHMQQQHFQQQQMQQQLLLQPQEQINIQQNQTQVLNNMQLQDQQQQSQILSNLQLQQQQMENIQPQNPTQVLGNMPHPSQQQSQILNNLQLQHQQQILDNIQQQNQSHVLGNLQIQDQQQQTQILNTLQMQQQQNQVLSNLQQQQVLESFHQQLQAELLQPQLQPQVQQPVSLLQQAGELLTIQTSFPSQPPAHSSPPQQLFQSPRPLAETQGTQQLLQNTISALNSEPPPTGSALYLSPTAPSHQEQPQQLALISSMETSSNQSQPVSMFQSQPQTPISQMQQPSTPMEQQQSSQQTSEQTSQTSLFQSLANHSQPNSVAQPQQTGLLLCTADMNSQATLLFSTTAQGPAPIGSISVGLSQSDTTEPMSFQDGSTGNNSGSGGNQQPTLFQEQQPMQVSNSSAVQNSQPVELFLPPSSLSNLQSTIGSQELTNQATASGPTIFVVQGGVGVVGNPGQRPPEQLFQTTITGNVASQGQPNLFVFGLQNGKILKFV
uniref:Nuclear factor of activated T cells 5a n=1 Tax=Neogobius melanostomus TaxID=47308 RepID=A0A8C6S981_9GOBI